MSVVVLYAVGGLVIGFGIGWLACGLARRHRHRASEDRWRSRVEQLEAELALARLRSENRQRESQIAAAESASALEFPHQLAQRPARASDSSPARA